MASTSPQVATLTTNGLMQSVRPERSRMGTNAPTRIRNAQFSLSK